MRLPGLFVAAAVACVVGAAGYSECGCKLLSPASTAAVLNTVDTVLTDALQWVRWAEVIVPLLTEPQRSDAERLIAEAQAGVDAARTALASAQDATEGDVVGAFDRFLAAQSKLVALFKHAGVATHPGQLASARGIDLPEPLVARMAAKRGK